MSINRPLHTKLISLFFHNFVSSKHTHLEIDHVSLEDDLDPLVRNKALLRISGSIILVEFSPITVTNIFYHIHSIKF